MVCVNGSESARKGRRDYTLYSVVREALVSDSPRDAAGGKNRRWLLLVSQSCSSLTHLVLEASFLASSRIISLFCVCLSNSYPSGCEVLSTALPWDCFRIPSWLCSVLAETSIKPSQPTSVLLHFNHRRVPQSHRYLFMMLLKVPSSQMIL